jgi:hypothetical protein
MGRLGSVDDTQWMELEIVNDSMSLAGSRCILVKYSHLRNHFVLDLHDFNPYRVAIRARRTRNRLTATTAIVSEAATTAGITTLAVLGGCLVCLTEGKCGESRIFG